MVRRIIKYFFLVSAHLAEFIILNLCQKIFPLQFQKLTSSPRESYAFAMTHCQASLGTAKMGTALKPIPG